MDEQPSNVIQLLVIPRKPADRGFAYRCIRCCMEWTQEERLTREVYCGCGGDVRPVEAK